MLKGDYTTRFGNFVTNSLKFMKVYVIRKEFYKEDNGNVDFSPKITIL